MNGTRPKAKLVNKRNKAKARDRKAKLLQELHEAVSAARGGKAAKPAKTAQPAKAKPAAKAEPKAKKEVKEPAKAKKEEKAE